MKPLLTHWHKEASGSWTHHIDHYLQSQVGAAQSGVQDDDAKIVDAYEVIPQHIKTLPTSSI